MGGQKKELTFVECSLDNVNNFMLFKSVPKICGRLGEISSCN